MKKFIFALALLAATAGTFSLQSCERVKEAVEDTTVPVPFPVSFSFETDIPFATIDVNTYVPYPEIKTNIDIDKVIKDKYPKLSADNLKKAYLTDLNIKLLSTKLNVGNNLKAVKNARIYIKTPTLEKVLVAEVKDNTSEQQLNFQTISNVDIAPYLKSKENSLLLEIQGNSTSLDEFKIQINPTFKIEVGL